MGWIAALLKVEIKAGGLLPALGEELARQGAIAAPETNLRRDLASVPASRLSSDLSVTNTVAREEIGERLSMI